MKDKPGKNTYSFTPSWFYPNAACNVAYVKLCFKPSRSVLILMMIVLRSGICYVQYQPGLIR